MNAVRAVPVIDPVTADRPRPFWSVMIPCYNSAQLLARTLESVLVQDPGPEVMQIEVVDDGSTLDDPARVVDGVGGGRVGYWRQPVNVGAPANFTTCVRRSAGRWVHVLHSDDVVLPGFYARYREQIERCPDAVMVGAQTILVDAAERYVGVTAPLDVDNGYLRDPALTIATRHPLQCVAAVVARSAYEQAGGFDAGLAHANDWELWSRLASSGPVAWLDEPLGLYRTHPDSDSNRLRRSTAYIDDCLAAAATIAGRFDDEQQHRLVSVAARRIVSDYALDVGLDLARQGWFRMGARNAIRAMRIDTSVHTWSRALEVIHVAGAGRMAATTGRRPSREPPAGATPRTRRRRAGSRARRRTGRRAGVALPPASGRLARSRRS